jgi:hypothetical protein
MVQEKPGRTAALELSFAFMGLLKLLGLETRLFRRWGMSPRAMRRIGTVELLGAFLVANEGTRPIAAAGLAAISSMLLATELRNHEAELILPRAAVTLLALRTAMAGGAKLRSRVAA